MSESKNFPQFNFSKEQLKAINHFRGPALVVAGPGSGKTAVITHRVYNLINTYQINPQNILVITFSKAAALQMQQRFNNIQNSISYPVYFGTFHSLFFSIIRKHKHLSKENIVTEREKRKYISDILFNLFQIKNADIVFVDNIIKAISFCKNTGTNSLQEELGINEDDFIRVFQNYESMMNFYKKIDFEDMMLLCHECLIQNPQLRREYSNNFSFILIDEFQDINPLQYKIIRLLLGKEENIFVVGDDDQSIYGFRGSTPGIMSEFPKDYSECETIMLSTNYRSTNSIVKISELLINENKNRFKKSLNTHNNFGEKNVLYITESRKAEADLITDFILKRISAENESNIAVLFRTNSKMTLFAETLKSNNVKFSSEAQNESYVINILKDFYSYLQLAKSNNIYETAILFKIINKPYRFINISLIQGETIEAFELKRIFFEDLNVSVKIDKFVKDLDVLKDLDIYGAFSYFRKIIGYDEYIRKRYMEDEEKIDLFIDLLNSLTEKMKSFKGIKDLEKYKLLIEQADNSSKIRNERVNLMTFHSSKGLEFDYVLIPDLNDGIIPEKRAVTPRQTEEERRMLYVAFTRAKKELVLMYVKDGKKKNTYSKFLKPFINSEDLLEIKSVSDNSDTLY